MSARRVQRVKIASSHIAIGVLCNCPLSLASRQQLARKTILGGHGNSIDGNSLLGYLKNEVHVGTACVGVGVLVKWCGVIGEGGDEVPTLLLEHIKVFPPTIAKVYLTSPGPSEIGHNSFISQPILKLLRPVDSS